MTDQDSKLTFLQAAQQVLAACGQPLHAEAIAERALTQGLLTTHGKTPEATMHAILAVDAKRPAEKRKVVRVGPGTFALVEWAEGGQVSPLAEPGESKVRVPHFPTYPIVCGALRAWAGVTRAAILELRSEIHESTGTPQATQDWSNPAEWIPQRLSGQSREVAMRTWEVGQVNPRYTTGAWYLITNYDLLMDGPGSTLALTEDGQDLLANPTGGTAQRIDESEGLLELLRLVAAVGPAARRDLVDPWREFLAGESRVQAESTAKSYLWARLRNLDGRGLVGRVGVKYAITDAGVTYLESTGYSGGSPDRGETTLLDLIHRQLASVRESLAELLANIDPIAFEHLVKELLEAMSYKDVQVTVPSGDKGVDVIANIELGISSVKEVVQVKRHGKNIQRHVLDALRGSLHRFNAVRGTIITTSDFAKGTREAAFEPGAAPITLINGEKLIDLLIENGIGVKKRKVELLEVDPAAFGGGVVEDSE